MKPFRMVAACILLLAQLLSLRAALAQPPRAAVTFERYIRQHLPAREEIDVFLNDMSWAQFDSEVGYVLSNYMPRDGIDSSSTISTVRENGARTAFLYRGQPCRINSYGNSFTHCHQVSDGETWQEYLAGHLGEPIGNFGMGGFGVYQAYRRMIREEQTQHQAPYVILYIWGDDHIRSLLRCRYMLIGSWNRSQDRQEGRGRMFHGNFWSNIEMDLATGQLVEKENLLPTRESLYKMTDPDWMVEHLRDDLALQMGLFIQGEINSLDVVGLRQLSEQLGRPLTVESGQVSRAAVASLLDAYSFAATKAILRKARDFTTAHNKQLLVILFDPYRVTRPLLEGHASRYDQDIVDFLGEQEFHYFDMNLVHCEDYKNFQPDVNAYFRRYFIGHYNPAGNHFFAYALKDTIVEWLDPKPLPYRDQAQQVIDFKGYLRDY